MDHRSKRATLGALLGAALISASMLAGPGLATAAEARAPDHFRAYVDGPWGQIHVRVAGRADAPTILMLHKMVWSSVEFAKVQPALERLGFRTIAVDLPGYGLSDAPEREPSAEDFADALVPILDHFGLKQVVIMGSDTGAVVAVAFADRHPDRTSKMVLEGVPLFDAATLARLLQEKAIDRTPQPDGSEFTHRIQGIVATLPKGALTPEELHVGAMQFFDAGPNYLYGHHAAFKYDLAAGLKAVRVPTEIVNYPGKASADQLPKVKALRPDFTYVQLDNRGLMATYDEPEVWAEAVAGFLKR